MRDHGVDHLHRLDFVALLLQLLQLRDIAKKQHLALLVVVDECLILDPVVPSLWDVLLALIV